MVSRDILRKILERCRKVASEIKDEYYLYHDPDVDLVLEGDTYIMKFRVRDFADVTYETPVFHKYDELPKWAPEDYEEFCYKVLRDMAKLATAEY